MYLIAKSKKFIYVIAIFNLAVLLTGCGDDGSAKGNKLSSGSSPKVNADQAANPVNLNEITNHNFSLKNPLTFDSAESKQYKMFAGTDMETDVVRYSYFFQQQKPVKASDLTIASTYCELYVETDPSTQKSDVHFDNGQDLKVVQQSSYATDGHYSFVIMLQAGIFQNLSLKCQNVSDTAALDAQVGNIILVSAKTN